MADRSVQLRAAFLLLLLFGAECARISRHVNYERRANSSMTPGKAEKLFQEGNGECKLSISKLRCEPKGVSDDSKCEFKHMHKDRPFVDSCRLSSTWMLTNAPYWASVRAGVIEAKAEKYARHCTGGFAWAMPVCWRRAQHISRGVNFLTQALDPKYNLSAKDADEISASLAKVTKSLSGSGPNSEKVQKLTAAAKKKLEEGANGVTVLRKTAKVLWGLFFGSGASKKEAEQFIDNLESDGTDGRDPWGLTVDELMEDVGETNKSVHQQSADVEAGLLQFADMGHHMESMLEEGGDSLDTAVEDILAKSENGSSSLAEVRNGDMTEGPFAWFLAGLSVIATVLLYLFTSLLSFGTFSGTLLGVTVAGPYVILGLIGYVMLATIGCGLYTGINNLLRGKANWMTCFAKSLSLPFMLVGNALECVAKMFFWPFGQGAAFRCQPLPMFAGFWDPRVNLPNKSEEETHSSGGDSAEENYSPDEHDDEDD